MGLRLLPRYPGTYRTWHVLMIVPSPDRYIEAVHSFALVLRPVTVRTRGSYPITDSAATCRQDRGRTPRSARLSRAFAAALPPLRAPPGAQFAAGLLLSAGRNRPVARWVGLQYDESPPLQTPQLKFDVIVGYQSFSRQVAHGYPTLDNESHQVAHTTNDNRAPG